MNRFFSTLRKISPKKQINYRLKFLRKNDHLKKYFCATKSLNNGCVCEPSKEDNKQKIQPRILDEYLNLNCKTAVVVGGEDGIGYAAAHEILSRKAKVVGIFGKNVCKGMEACHALNCRFGKRKAVFFEVDVTSQNDIECAICKLTEEFDRIEAFVHSFAIFNGQNWEHELNTNLIGMARCTIAAHRYLSDSKKGGVIINTSGIFGLVPLPGSPTVSAAQHGIIGLSKSFGTDCMFKHSNVRVIALCPGITQTKLFHNAHKRALTPHMGECLQKKIGEMKKQRPEACGNAIVWLLRYGHSGSVWLINGGEMYKMKCEVLNCCSELYIQFAA